MIDSHPNGYDQLSVGYKKVPIDEPQLYDTLKDLEGNKDYIFVIEGLPSVQTLRLLATQLTYEVHMLVSVDLKNTSFIPGTKNHTVNFETLKELGFHNIRCDMHNHPSGDPTPSPGDIIHGKQSNATYLTIAKDGISEYTSSTTNPLEGMYRYAQQIGTTPWRNMAGYEDMLRQKAMDELSTDLLYLRLSDLEKQEALTEEMGHYDYNLYKEYYLGTDRNERFALMRAFLSNHQPVIAKFFSWEEEDVINELLRGKSQLNTSA